ncbi:phage tail protein, partial [Salmonella enterica]|nr:phage tail protein [Salmonella enterica subsp. enterica serovar Cerro]EDQ4046141.1 phage tail protein [Salmonella enterica subsp. enterica serovar Cerro]
MVDPLTKAGMMPFARYFCIFIN